MFSFHLSFQCNRIRDAIDCCIHLNHWNMAIDLARQHAVKDIDSLLTKYAGHLLEKGRNLNAIELYRKAGHYLEAAKLLMKVRFGDSIKKENYVLIFIFLISFKYLILFYYFYKHIKSESKYLNYFLKIHILFHKNC